MDNMSLTYRLKLPPSEPNCSQLHNRTEYPAPLGALIIASICSVHDVNSGKNNTPMDGFVSWYCRKAEDLKCPRDDITFWLYTRDNKDKPSWLNPSDPNSLKGAPFVFAPLKVIVHGFSKNKKSAGTALLTKTYLSHGEYNVVVVDWGLLAEPGVMGRCYPQAVANVPTVALCVAQFINTLVSARSFPSVHLLGHSLGAHVCAQASHKILELNRVTGIDPALPYFNDDSELLIKASALLVDVYHTNSGRFGRRSPDGNVDVYFNSEQHQPGCGCFYMEQCSHGRGIDYYLESISHPQRMVAFPCEGWVAYTEGRCEVNSSSDLVVVGEGVNPNTSGSFLMFTHAEKPFLVDPAIYTDLESLTNFSRSVSQCSRRPRGL